MKKNSLLVLMSLLLFTTETQAQDRFVDDSYESCCSIQTNFYGKILGGANFLENTSINENKSKYKSGYLISGSWGYCWQEGLSLEFEYAYRRNEIRKIHFFAEGLSKRGHVQTSSYMANLVWELPFSSWKRACWDIQPIVGIGIGYDFQQMRSSNSRLVFKKKWNRFCWQLMTGLAYPLFCNTEMTLEYKYHQGGRFYNHAIGVGLLYRFGYRP